MDSLSRRDFTKRILAAGATMSAGILSLTGCNMKNNKQIPIGIQLYTVRDHLKNDFTGTVKKIAEIGYNAVEFAGYGGLTSTQIVQLLKETGLLCAGTHIGFEALENDLQGTIDFHKEINSPNIVVPSMPGKWRENGLESVTAFAKKMDEYGQAVKDAGIQLCYHNHSFEFDKIEGKTIFDIIFETTHPEFVQIEMDVAWVHHAGVNPAELIARYSDRCPMLHLKDLADSEKTQPVPVGSGIVDIPAVLEAGQKAGVAWYIVEQDSSTGSILEDIEKSLKYLRNYL